MAEWRPLWCARTPGPGIDHVWQPGQPAPQAAEAVLALWVGVPGPDTGEGDLAGNSRLARAAMALGRQAGAAQVLHLSSSAVYGPGQDMDERHPCVPATAYGAAKLEMETVVAAETTPAACVLRLANVVGADSLFAALQSGQPMVIDQFRDGQGPQRSYALPSTILQVVAAVLAAPEMPGRLNLASPGAVDMAALARAAGPTSHGGRHRRARCSR